MGRDGSTGLAGLTNQIRFRDKVVDGRHPGIVKVKKEKDATLYDSRNTDRIQKAFPLK